MTTKKDLFVSFTEKMGELWRRNANRVEILKKEDRYDGLSEVELNIILGKIDARAFRFSPWQRLYIPKENKPWETRPITIPDKKDVIVMDALLHVLTDVYEPVFLDCSHGFRPKRGVPTFCAQVASWSRLKWILRADFRRCFDRVPHEQLVAFLRKRIHDERIMGLLTAFCACKVWDIKNHQYLDLNGIGIPQGSSLAPLLMNVFCHEVDWAIMKEFPNLHYVRYADDLLLASYEPEDGVCINEIRRKLGLLLAKNFRFQVETKPIFPGGPPAKVLGVHLSISGDGYPYFHAIKDLIKRRIMIAHKRRQLPPKDWRTKFQGYLALYACCREADYRNFEAFLKNKSSRLLDELEEDERDYPERLTRARALNAVRKFRSRFFALVAENKKALDQKRLAAVTQYKPP